MKEAFAWIGGIILALLIIAAVVAGGQQAGFWLQHNQTEFESRNFRDSFANQERLREDASEKNSEVVRIETEIAELDPKTDEALIAQLESQAEAINDKTCHDLGQVNELTPEANEIAAERC